MCKRSKANIIPPLQVALAAELRKRLPTDGSVAAFACHPGECVTDITRNLPRWMHLGAKLVLPRILLTPENGEPWNVLNPFECVRNLPNLNSI